MQKHVATDSNLNNSQKSYFMVLSKKMCNCFVEKFSITLIFFYLLISLVACSLKKTEKVVKLMLAKVQEYDKQTGHFSFEYLEV